MSVVISREVFELMRDLGVCMSGNGQVAFGDNLTLSGDVLVYLSGTKEMASIVTPEIEEKTNEIKKRHEVELRELKSRQKAEYKEKLNSLLSRTHKFEKPVSEEELKRREKIRDKIKAKYGTVGNLAKVLGVTRAAVYSAINNVRDMQKLRDRIDECINK